jgi:tetratricopeptide (TPR) repeat protein
MTMTAAEFVGREAELSALRHQVIRSLDRRGSICFVTGEPGAGKSSLLAEFVGQAQIEHPGLLAATGRCSAYGGVGDAYLPFKEILQQLTSGGEQGLVEGGTNSESVSRLRAFMSFAKQTLVENGPDLIDLFVPGGGVLTKIGGRAVGQLGWARRPGDRSRNTIATPELTQDHVFEQCTQVLEAMSADRPLLLVVDDMHWADPATVGLFFHLARRLVNDPVAIVGAYRPAEVLHGRDGFAHPLREVVSELRREQGEIEVSLDAADPRGFVDALLDRVGRGIDAGFREALTRHTNGNALFAVELLNSLEQTGVLSRDRDGRLAQRTAVSWGTQPSRIAGVIESRLGRLNRAEQEILAAAAVQGDDFDADVVGHVVGASRQSVVGVLSGALAKQHHLVSAIGRREVGEASLAAYRFRHSLVRDYLYRQLDEIERGELHTAVGAAIEALHGSSGSTAALLAMHYGEGGRHAQALQWHLQAAQAAAVGCAPVQAIGHFETALALHESRTLPWPATAPTRSSVLEQLGGQLVLVGRYADGRRQFESCLADCETDPGDGAAELRSHLWRKLAEAHERENRYDDALAALGRAQLELGPEPRERAERWWGLWLEAELAQSGIHYWRNDAVQMAASEARLRPAVERWADSVQRSRYRYETVRQTLRRNRYRSDAATVAQARLAVEGLDPAVASEREGEVWFGLGFAHLWAEELAEAQAGFETALAIARRIGSAMLKARSLIYLSLVHRLGHRDADVARLNGEARELVAQIGAANYVAMTSAQDAWLAWRRLDHAAALAHADRAIATWLEKSPRYPVQWPGWWVRAGLAAEAGDGETVARAFRAMLAPTQTRQPDQLEDLMRGALAAHDAADVRSVDDGRLAIERARAGGLL